MGFYVLISIKIIMHFVSSQLALSASAPIYRGYLSDIDTRWPVISASVDDRTEEERGLKVSKN